MNKHQSVYMLARKFLRIVYNSPIFLVMYSMYIHTHTYVCMIRMLAGMHTCTHTHAHTYTHACTHTCTCIQAQIRNTHILAGTHTCTRTYTHTHTLGMSLFCFFPTYFSFWKFFFPSLLCSIFRSKL